MSNPTPSTSPAVEHEMNGHVLFSVRDKISEAIANPGLYFERLRSDDNLIEAPNHWQARAAIEAMMQCAASSPSFVAAIQARAPQPPKQSLPSALDDLAEHLCARRPCGDTPENVRDWLAYSLERCGLTLMKAKEPLPHGVDVERVERAIEDEAQRLNSRGHPTELTGLQVENFARAALSAISTKSEDGSGEVAKALSLMASNFIGLCNDAELEIVEAGLAKISATNTEPSVGTVAYSDDHLGIDKPTVGVSELPDDDEPKTWRELAKAAIMDLRRYADDELPHRRMVSVEAYEQRFKLIDEATGQGSSNQIEGDGSDE